MILTDEDVKVKLEKILKLEKSSEKEKEIIKNCLILLNQYSYINNQTYPRPSHPIEEKRTDAYFTLVAILLSLRTTLENEIKATYNFMEHFKTIDEVLNTDIKIIAEIIKCAGMPLKKAKTIIDASEYIKKVYSSDINNILVNDMNTTRENLLKIPGVGNKSADCMLELAFNMPSIVIDVNVFRVISRYYFYDKKLEFSNEKDIFFIKEFLEEILTTDYELYQIVHTLILLNGKYNCKSKPKCEECKVNKNCSHFNNNYKEKQMKLF